MTRPTDLAHDLVVFQNAPGDVDAVVVPVGARHVLVDVGVDARDAWFAHPGCGRASLAVVGWRGGQQACEESLRGIVVVKEWLRVRGEEEEQKETNDLPHAERVMSF